MQPRRKKRFIDKKKAQKFILVPRSLQDPETYNDDASKFVLHPVGGPDLLDEETTQRLMGMDGASADGRSARSPSEKIPGQHLSEVDEMGLVKKGGYDYSKHLRPITGAGVFVSASGRMMEQDPLRQVEPPRHRVPAAAFASGGGGAADEDEVGADFEHDDYATIDNVRVHRSVLPTQAQLGKMLQSVTLREEAMPRELQEVFDSAMRQSSSQAEARAVMHRAVRDANAGHTTVAFRHDEGAEEDDGRAAAAREEEEEEDGDFGFTVEATDVDGWEELQDDFVMEAMGIKGSMEGEAHDGGQADAETFDFEAHVQRLMEEAGDEWDDDSDEEAVIPPGPPRRGQAGDSEGFTGSAAVGPSGMRQLNDEFDVILAQYDDAQIGDPGEDDDCLSEQDEEEGEEDDDDEEEEEEDDAFGELDVAAGAHSRHDGEASVAPSTASQRQRREAFADRMLALAMEDFMIDEKPVLGTRGALQHPNQGEAKLREEEAAMVRSTKAALDRAATGEGQVEEEDDEEGDKDDEELDEGNDLADIAQFEYLRQQPKAEWDCETILTTFSTLDNHPRVISADETAPRIRSKRPRVPDAVGTADAPRGHRQGDEPPAATAEEDEEEEEEKDASGAVQVPPRRKGETAEEKRQRKLLAKQQRRQQRERKKEVKDMFKREAAGIARKDASAAAAHGAADRKNQTVFHF